MGGKCAYRLESQGCLEINCLFLSGADIFVCFGFCLGLDSFGLISLIPESNLDCLVMQLVLLNVSNNKLKSLPESIGSCYSLEELQANGT